MRRGGTWKANKRLDKSQATQAARVNSKGTNGKNNKLQNLSSKSKNWQQVLIEAQD